MAIKVRCKNCRKKISMDEAFAGGVCRCPYCGALNMAGGSAASGGKVERPDRPDRPDTPGTAAVPEEAVDAEPEHIPLARPVRIQGIVALVLIALMLMMIVAVGVWAYMYFGGTNGNGNGGGNGPVTVDGPSLIDVPITAPVVYVLDASGDTQFLYGSAKDVVRHSVRSLGGSRKFQLMLVRSKGVEMPSTDWLAGGADGDNTVKPFLNARTAGGKTNLAAAIERGIALKPKTLAVISGSALSTDPDRAGALAAKASEAGVTVQCVSLGAFEEVTAPMRTLSEATGGQCRAYEEDVLIGRLKAMGSLP